MSMQTLTWMRTSLSLPHSAQGQHCTRSNTDADMNPHISHFHTVPKGYRIRSNTDGDSSGGRGTKKGGRGSDSMGAWPDWT
eukprot:scaffold155261_cov22-Tisochrysis_lutea.AAC.1